MNAAHTISFPLVTPALRVDQPLGEFYVVVLPASVLLEVTYSDPLELEWLRPDGSYGLRGHQRELVRDRLIAIGRYIDTVEAAFPNSIILAANYDKDGLLLNEGGSRWGVHFEEKQDVVGSLVIPTADKVAAIVDGQHRLYGFTRAEVSDRRNMPLLCAVFLDLPHPYQAYLFATINYNQKAVDKSQSYELYGFNLEEEPPQAWSPEKTAVYLCRRLNTDSESVFQSHIIVAAQMDDTLAELARIKQKEWAVSTATVVEGLLKLISANPKRDRDLMHRVHIGSGRQRSILSTDSSPLRELYLTSNDKLIYILVRNYFSAAFEVLGSPIPDSYIRKTIGIQALFDVLRRVSLEAIAATDASEEYFRGRLSGFESINFRDDFFQASGIGRVRLRNVLELAIGLKKLNDMPVDDVESYRRITGM